MVADVPLAKPSGSSAYIGHVGGVFGEGLSRGQLEKAWGGKACRCFAEISVFFCWNLRGGGEDEGEEGNLCILVTALQFLETVGEADLWLYLLYACLPFRRSQR